jgi:outer membrane protein assembly factor BamB
MKTTAVFILLFSSAFLSSAQKQDEVWPQFRGLNGSGVALQSAKPPVVFNESNLLWKTLLPQGFSSPVIWKDKLFVTGFIESKKELQTVCLDRVKGEIIWSRSVLPDTIEKFHSISGPAQSTVVLDGERVVSYFGSCGLFCYDIDGNLLWKRQMPCNKATYGSATSPVITGDKLIFVYDIGAIPYILALNKKTGSEIWKTILKKPSIPNVGGHSVPCINNDIIYVHRVGEIAGFSVKDGSQLCNYKLLTEGVSSPIIAGNKVVTACWYNFSEENQRGKLPSFDELIKNYDKNQNGTISKTELPEELIFYSRPESDLDGTSRTVKSFFGSFDTNRDNEILKQEWNEGLKLLDEVYYVPAGLVAIDLKSRGELSDSSVLWRVPANIPEVPTAIFFKNRIYIVKDGGILTCVDPESGKVIYSTRIGNSGPYLASPIAANGFLYIFGFNGKMKVIKAGDKLEIAGQYDFKENIGATPAIIGNTIYIRTKTQLLAYTSK